MKVYLIREIYLSHLQSRINEGLRWLGEYGVTDDQIDVKIHQFTVKEMSGHEAPIYLAQITVKEEREVLDRMEKEAREYDRFTSD